MADEGITGIEEGTAGIPSKNEWSVPQDDHEGARGP